MDAYVDIGGSEALALKGALLVYQGRNRVFVTWHEVRYDDGERAPYLGEAQELTTCAKGYPLRCFLTACWHAPPRPSCGGVLPRFARSFLLPTTPTRTN